MSQRKYCSPLAWIKEQSKDLYEAIVDSCNAPKLNTRGGVTFLYPQEPKDLAALVKEVNLGGKEADDAVKNRCLPMTLKRAGDWTGAGKVYSKSGYVFRDPAADGRKVKVGELTLEPADFQFHSQNGESDHSAAVWYYKGPIPRSGEKFTPDGGPSGSRPRQAPRTGGAEAAAASRMAVARKVNTKFAEFFTKAIPRDPVISAVVSLLMFLEGSHREDYAKALGVMDVDPYVTFFLVVDPYCGDTAAGEAVIGDEAFGAWAKTSTDSGLGDELSQYWKYLAAARAAQAAQAADPAAADPAANPAAARDKALKVMQDSAKDFGKAIQAAYGEGAPALKRCWRDEMRFCMHVKLAEIRAIACVDPGNAIQLLNELIDCCDSHSKGPHMISSTPTGLIRPKVCEQFAFVNSSDFLFKLSYRADPKGVPAEASPMSGDYVDRSIPAQCYLKWLRENQPSADGEMSETLKSQIANFKRAYGAAKLAELIGAMN